MDEGEVVHARRHMGEQIADPFAGLAVLLEAPFRSDNSALIAMSAAAMRLHGDRFAV